VPNPFVYIGNKICSIQGRIKPKRNPQDLRAFEYDQCNGGVAAFTAAALF
jgi:hypothetical protein